MLGHLPYLVGWGEVDEFESKEVALKALDILGSKLGIPQLAILTKGGLVFGIHPLFVGVTIWFN